MPPIPRPNPELMIIGDSLAQGCRSLTVSDRGLRHGLVAERFGS